MYEGESVFFKGMALGKLTMLQWQVLYPEIYKRKIGLCGLQEKINKAHDEKLIGKDLRGVKGNRGKKHGQNTLYTYIKFS